MRFLILLVLFFLSLQFNGFSGDLKTAISRYNRVLKTYSSTEMVKKGFEVKSKGEELCFPSQLLNKKSFFSTFAVKVSENDLVVGYSDSNEVLNIANDTVVNGDVYVINNGKLNIDGCDFTVKGNIFVLNDGRLNIRNSTLRFLSDYVYSKTLAVFNNGRVDFEGVEVYSGGFVIAAGFLDSSSFIVRGCTFADGVTIGLYDSAFADVQGISGVEWVIEDSSSLYLKDSQSGYNLVWTVYGEGSNADLTFPDGNYVSSYTISGLLPYVSGVDFTLNISNCSGLLWGIMVSKGASVIIRDSTLRGVAISCDSDKEWSLSGIVNNSHFEHYTLPSNKFHLEFYNVSTGAFNIYQDGAKKVNIANSVFGEFGAMEGEEFSIVNSIIDGTGGYLFSKSSINGIMVDSLLNSHVVTSDNSVMVFFNSSIERGDIIADGESIILLSNTLYQSLPVCYKSSLIVEGRLDRLNECFSNSVVPVCGTSFQYNGETNFVPYRGYQLFFKPENGDNWMPVSDLKEGMVRDGILAFWNTNGVESGNYNLMMKVYVGDSSLDIPLNVSVLEGSSLMFSIPHIDSGDYWETYLVLDNSDEFNQTAVLHTVCEDGIKTRDIMLSPFERKTVLLNGNCGFVKCDRMVFPSEFFVSKSEGGVAQFNLLNSTSDTLNFLYPVYLSEKITWKGLAVQNATSFKNRVLFYGYSKNGDEIGRGEVELKPDERRAFLLKNLFPEVQFEEIARVKMVAEKPVNGIAISGEGNKSLLYTNAVSDSRTSIVLVPHIANEFNTWRNLLVFDNASDEDLIGYLTLYSNSQKVVDRYEVKVKANSQRVVGINQLFSELSPDCGFVEVSNSLFVRQVFVSNDGGFAEFLLNGKSGKIAVFNLPTGDFLNLNWHGIAISNISDTIANVTLNLYSNNGLQVQKSLEINPHSRVAFTLKELFGDMDFSLQNRVVAYSNTPITGIVIGGNGLDKLLFLPCVFKP